YLGGCPCSRVVFFIPPPPPLAGVSGGPYGEKTRQKTCVKEAEKASRLFYFGKNKMRFFQNKIYLAFIDS
ncbi:MAG: hypothetical protein K1V98_10660, partial [Prevotella sp.]